MNKVKVYISHPIRGMAGNDATKEVKDNNNQAAMDFAKLLRHRFPGIWLYCPAEHEDWIQKALTEKIISINNILEIDCDIVSECNILLVYSPDSYISDGMWREIDRANETGLTVVMCPDIACAKIYLDLELERMKVG